MNRRQVILNLVVAVVCACCSLSDARAETAEQHSRTRDIGFGWKFFNGDPADAERVAFDDSAWQDVDIPHDWSIEGPKEQRNPGGNRIGFFPPGLAGIGSFSSFQTTTRERTSSFNSTAFTRIAKCGSMDTR